MSVTTPAVAFAGTSFSIKVLSVVTPILCVLDNLGIYVDKPETIT